MIEESAMETKRGRNKPQGKSQSRVEESLTKIKGKKQQSGRSNPKTGCLPRKKSEKAKTAQRALEQSGESQKSKIIKKRIRKSKYSPTGTTKNPKKLQIDSDFSQEKPKKKTHLASSKKARKDETAFPKELTNLMGSTSEFTQRVLQRKISSRDGLVLRSNQFILGAQKA